MFWNNFQTVQYTTWNIVLYLLRQHTIPVIFIYINFLLACFDHKKDNSATTNTILCELKLYAMTIIMGLLINPLNAELNPICPLLALFSAHHILHVRR
jgi:hypothetical protein